jgi:hypothetical protein
MHTTKRENEKEKKDTPWFTLEIMNRSSWSGTKPSLDEAATANHQSPGSYSQARTITPMKQYLFTSRILPPPLSSIFLIVAVFTFSASANTMQIATLTCPAEST